MGKLIAAMVALVSCAALAQAPKLEPRADSPAPVPTVTFAFELPGARPGHYLIAVESDGKAAYRSKEVAQPGATPGEPYLVKFLVSEPTRTRIFDLARALNYFKGDFEYRNGRIANMGAKTLTYADDGKESHTSFNYSTNADLQQLTRIFQNMATTLEYGRQLTYLYRYDKLGLENELKHMEEDAKAGNLIELQVDQAILQTIADDHSIMNISRHRADRLLALIHSNPAMRAAAPQ